MKKDFLKKYTWMVCLLSGLMAGCSDDSNGSTEQLPDIPDAQKGEPCDADITCDTGLQCDDGICVELRGEGDTCLPGDHTVCRDGLECEGGVCIRILEKGASCDGANRAKCREPLTCYSGKCVTFVDEGDTCNTVDLCKADLLCVGGICKPKAPEEVEICASDEDCAANQTAKTCLSSGLCGTIVGEGELCQNGKVECEEGMTCLGACVYVVGEDEPCDDMLRVCDEEAFCIDGFCHTPQYNLERGMECNPSWLFCQTDLTCQDGRCSTFVAENEACAPDEYIFCEEGKNLLCLKNKCTPVGTECESTQDCVEKDSYCCLNEECGAMNKCVPYDEDTTHDDMCRFQTKPGIFEAQIQCRFKPAATDDSPNSSAVEMMPLVGPFGNKLGLKTVIGIVTRTTRDSNPKLVRFIHPETCEVLESIRNDSLGTSWNNYPAAADLDGDGLMEFIAVNSSNKAIAYKWNAEKQKHEVYWTASVASGGTPLVFDVNGDGLPEVIGGTSVLNGQTGATIYSGSNNGSATYSIGNFDHDPNGYASLLTSGGVFKWDDTSHKWIKKLSFSGNGGHTAYADFGTPGATAADFDFTKLDGYPEYVFSGGNKLTLYAQRTKEDGTYEAQLLMDVRGYTTGGPVTIGDFNNDGLPEIGIASSGLFGVYDPKCKAYEAGRCADTHVMWERWSQDNTSGATGSSLFDFDGDGQAEAVYADECFTRVYDGKTGKVLFSARRSSHTSVEGPVVADIDNDGSAEILMGSDASISCYGDAGETKTTTGVDPIHEGIRCMDDEDCPKGVNCRKDLGLCTCQTDDDCNTQYAPGKDTYLKQYICTLPIHPDVGMMTNPKGAANRTMVKPRGTRPEGYDNSYKVCRATRATTDIGITDMMIFRDRLDRWVSSRNIWNQHAYNIINIEDDGKVPTHTQWWINWVLKKVGLTIDGTDQPRPEYNNYRLNKQGKYGAGMAPDITGRFIADSICGKTEEGKSVISAQLCNRGTKPVAMNLPATFYLYSEDAPGHRGEKICTSYTTVPVDIGVCGRVGCEVEDIEALAGQKVLVITNEDEHGNASTVECNYSNNTDTIQIDKCDVTIPPIN